MGIGSDEKEAVMAWRALACACVVCAVGGVCAGQVLYEAANGAPGPSSESEDGGNARAESGEGGEGSTGMPRPPRVSEVSLLAVSPPEPPSFAANDLITIIISERASTAREHTFESEKEYAMGGKVDTWVDMLRLLELRLQQGNRGGATPLAELGIDFEREFEGEGTDARDDRVTARVTARVLEAKPNGTLLLGARTVIATDTEEQSIVLSGLCRTEDVTDANTVMSNQMYDLRLDIQNTGDVRKGAEKGVIPKVLDALFNF